MSNKTYDVLKKIVLVVLPALATFYTVLSGIWGLPYMEQVVGTITAIDTLVGTILGISSKNYAKLSEGEAILVDDDDAEY